MSTSAPIAVIGAGLAGLTAAVTLKRSGVPFVLYESGPQIAGLRAAFAMTKVSATISALISLPIVWRRLWALARIVVRSKYYGESVYLQGKTYAYPFGLLRNLRYVGSTGWSRINGSARRRLSEQSADAWFRAQYGPALAEEVALPLLEAWSGVAAKELSVIGRRQNARQHGADLLSQVSQSRNAASRREWIQP